jgi:hypothetical protein
MKSLIAKSSILQSLLGKKISLFFTLQDWDDSYLASWQICGWSNREQFRARICELLRNPGIDSKESMPPAYVAWCPVRQAYLLCRPARLHRLAESILGLLKDLQIRTLGIIIHFYVVHYPLQYHLKIVLFYNLSHNVVSMTEPKNHQE